MDDIIKEIDGLLNRPDLEREDETTLITQRGRWKDNENSALKKVITNDRAETVRQNVRTVVAELKARYEYHGQTSAQSLKNDPFQLYRWLNRELQRQKLNDFIDECWEKEHPSPWIFALAGDVDSIPRDATTMLADHYKNEEKLEEKTLEPYKETDPILLENPRQAQRNVKATLRHFLDFGRSAREEDILGQLNRYDNQHLTFHIEVKNWTHEGMEAFIAQWKNLKRSNGKPILVFLEFIIPDNETYKTLESCFAKLNEKAVYLLPKLPLIRQEDFDRFFRRPIKERNMRMDQLYQLSANLNVNNGVSYRKAVNNLTYIYQETYTS